MQPYQERVVEELKELNIKRDKLVEFLKGGIFQKVDNDEQKRLIDQLSFMTHYANVLLERIAHFNAD